MLSFSARTKAVGTPFMADSTCPSSTSREGGVSPGHTASDGETVADDLLRGEIRFTNTQIDDQVIRSHDDYLNAMENHSAGDTVVFQTRRKDQERTFKVKLTESQ